MSDVQSVGGAVATSSATESELKQTRRCPPSFIQHEANIHAIVITTLAAVAARSLQFACSVGVIDSAGEGIEGLDDVVLEQLATYLRALARSTTKNRAFHRHQLGILLGNARASQRGTPEGLGKMAAVVGIFTTESYTDMRAEFYGWKTQMIAKGCHADIEGDAGFRRFAKFILQQVEGGWFASMDDPPCADVSDEGWQW